MHRIFAQRSYGIIAESSFARATSKLNSSRPLCQKPLAHRGLSTTPALLKKKDKTKASPVPESPSNPSAKSEDPFDLSQIDLGIATATGRLKDELSKLRAGGRFNTDSLESLRVQLGKDAQGSIRLRDVAQVVPKGGRMVTVLVSEEEVRQTHFACSHYCASHLHYLFFDSMSNLSALRSFHHPFP